MQNIIKLRCPKCSSIINIPVCLDLENKRIKCGACKSVSPYTEYTGVTSEVSSSDETKLLNPAAPIGILKIVGSSDAVYELKPGENIIGRKANSSKADIQIPTGDKRTMSREHLVIDVKGDAKKGYAHHVRLYKDSVCTTKVSEEQINYGDCIVLQSGDIIDMGDASLLFDVPDIEATKINS